MAYTRGKSAQLAATVLTVEQARRRNAELRLELGALTAENTKLQAQAVEMRKQVTTARKKLSRQIRDLEAIRLQAKNIAALAEHAGSPEPVFGGREGLQAATEEIRAHEDRGTESRRWREPSHGTGRRYALGCRCDDCRGWRGRKSTQEREHVKRRREQEITEALRAHGVTEEVAA